MWVWGRALGLWLVSGVVGFGGRGRLGLSGGGVVLWGCTVEMYLPYLPSLERSLSKYSTPGVSGGCGSGVVSGGVVGLWRCWVWGVVVVWGCLGGGFVGVGCGALTGERFKKNSSVTV